MRNEKWKVEFGGEKRTSRIFRWRKMVVFSTNFNMQGSNIWNIIEKRPEIAKMMFFKKIKIIEYIQVVKLYQTCFFNRFIYIYILCWKSYIKNGENLHSHGPICMQTPAKIAQSARGFLKQELLGIRWIPGALVANAGCHCSSEPSFNTRHRPGLQ